jgi:DNA-binding response OmpR family regulator
MNLDELTITRAGVPVRLPPMTFKILKILMLKSPSVVTREEMEHELWGDDCPDSDNLRTHMHNLRAAIDTPFDNPLIRTISGFGWTLRKE